MRALRPDQSLAMDSLRQALAEGKKHIVMQAPTGFGKTVLAAEVVASARRKGRRVLMTVPAISLVDQTVEQLWKQGVTEVGVMQADHNMRDASQPVQVASVQTLMKREMPDTDVVLIDEVHRWFEPYGEKWMRNPEVWLNKPVIGLSATPWCKPLGDFFLGGLIKASTTQELIDNGLLSDFKVFSPTHPDLAGIKTVGGDYQQDELSKRMRQVKLVADAVETWLEHGRGRPTLCFAVDCAHAKQLREKFEERGIKAGYQDAFTTASDRAAIKRGFHNGEIEVVCNVGTLTTGVDWDVRCISLCRPTKSEILFTQIMGRGLRTAVGKDYCLILDHSDNHLRLGFVTDIDASHNELPKGSRPQTSATDRIRLPKECPSCSFLKAPGTAVCPMCGFKAVAHCKIEPTAGELKELERKKKEAKTNVDPKAFFCQMKCYANERGKSYKWVLAQFKQKFDRWPPRDWEGLPAAVGVSTENMGWIKSRQIAWANSKRRFS